MKEILKRLKETIDPDNKFHETVIQFKIGDEFYELDRTRKKEWKLHVLFGSEIKLNTEQFTGLDREEVEEILKKKIRNIEIY